MNPLRVRLPAAPNSPSASFEKIVVFAARPDTIATHFPVEFDVSRKKESDTDQLPSEKQLNSMAITLKLLVQDPTLLQTKSGQRCACCGVLLQESITGKRNTCDGDVCSDCYYEKLGELIDQHPIVSGRVRRG